jgi:hypothetical protein
VLGLQACPTMPDITLLLSWLLCKLLHREKINEKPVVSSFREAKRFVNSFL